tara:strand:- start:144 stop:326 length:183 start_codon:yes stop_codon:yes gene_type:complete
VKKNLILFGANAGNSPVLKKATLTTPDLRTRETNTAVFFSLIEDSPKLKEVTSNQITIVI